MVRLIEDISKLTTIPEKVLQKLSSKARYCISDAVENSIMQDERIVEIDTGIGTLYLELKDDSVRYKFIPSDELEKNIKSTIVNKRNLLRDTLEMTLVNRIVNTYKELL